MINVTRAQKIFLSMYLHRMSIHIFQYWQSLKKQILVGIYIECEYILINVGRSLKNVILESINP